MVAPRNRPRAGNGRHDPPGRSRESTRTHGPIGKTPPDPGPEALHRLLKQFAELNEYVRFYVSAKLDGLKQSLRSLLAAAALGLIAFVAVIVVLAVGVSALVTGLAEALTVLLGGQAWAGNLLAGLLVVGGVAGGIYFAISKFKRAFEERMVMKYEERQASQQARFGRKVSDEAAAPATKE
jgi:hypothetical protein